MLNAFRHHGGRHDPARPARDRTGDVLNAFRHHGGRHEPVPGPWPPRGMCSTPFGITEGVTAVRVAALFLASGCSTPFGITEGVTRHEGCGRTPLRLCSTPFGITEGVTISTSQTERCSSSAQRLSASRRASRISENDGCNARDRGAQRLSASRRASPSVLLRLRLVGEVLNAFRHHGGRHALPRSRSSGPPSSAQRLSASRRASRRRSGRIAPCACVLNAFRHHGGRHAREGKTTEAAPGAQRLSASRRASPGHCGE